MRLFQADQMHVALVQLRNSLGPIFLLPYAPPTPLVGSGAWVGFMMVTDLGACLGRPMPFASLKYAVVVTEPQAAKLALRSDTLVLPSLFEAGASA